MINLGLQTPSKGPRVDTADMDGSSSDSLLLKPSTESFTQTATKMGCTTSGASVLKVSYMTSTFIWNVYVHFKYLLWYLCELIVNNSLECLCILEISHLVLRNEIKVIFLTKFRSYVGLVF